MAQVPRDRNRRGKRARRLAERLFRLMEQFDRFDVVLLNLDTILAAITPEDVKYVLKFYDLSELRSKLRGYASECETLAKKIDELLQEGMGT
jgi:hypothetical protein